MPASPSDDVQRILGSVSDLKLPISRDTLEGFLDELLTWNPSLGLVSRRGTAEVVASLLRNSFEMWEFVIHHGFPPGRATLPESVADIGSGAGFPGLIWKLLAPTLRLTLIERKERRTLFLERVVRRLALGGVEVLGADLHDLVERATHIDAFDLAAAVAVAPPQSLGPLVEHLIKPHGYFASIRSSRERALPTIGERLQLYARAETSSGILLLYQKH